MYYFSELNLLDLVRSTGIEGKLWNLPPTPKKLQLEAVENQMQWLESLRLI